MAIYTPQKNPRAAFITISSVVLFGILGSVFIHNYFLIVALIFWIQYTAVLSYLQFKRHSRHKFRGLTESLLVPQFRFFIFETIAFIGLMMILTYGSIIFGIGSLLAWWAFALNFYIHYSQANKT